MSWGSWDGFQFPGAPQVGEGLPGCARDYACDWPVILVLRLSGELRTCVCWSVQGCCGQDQRGTQLSGSEEPSWPPSR